MIDINLVRTDPDVVRQACRAKGSDVDVERLIEVDAELRRTQLHMEELRHQQKNVGRDTPIETARKLKEELRDATEQVRLLQEERDALGVRVPNLVADDTPIGA